MKVYLTNKTEINAKSGKQYFKYNGLTSEGENVELFLTAEQEEQFDIPAARIADSEKLEEALEALVDSVDVFYNARGRVDEIRA